MDEGISSISAQLSVTVVVSREDDRFVAQCLEVDVSSFGDTQERHWRW